MVTTSFASRPSKAALYPQPAPISRTLCSDLTSCCFSSNGAEFVFAVHSDASELLLGIELPSSLVHDSNNQFYSVRQFMVWQFFCFIILLEIKRPTHQLKLRTAFVKCLVPDVLGIGLYL